MAKLYTDYHREFVADGRLRWGEELLVASCLKYVGEMTRSFRRQQQMDIGWYGADADIAAVSGRLGEWLGHGRGS